MSEPGRLFDADVGRAEPEPFTLEQGERLVRVLPDVSGIAKEFDYVVPGKWADEVSVGTSVRVDLHGRRVPGWVVAVDVSPASGLDYRSISKVSSVGPPAELVDLARWAAHRWAGRLSPVLKSASPPTMVRAFPKPRPVAALTPAAATAEDRLAQQAFEQPGVTVVRVGPTDDQYRFVEAGAVLGNTLVVAPSVGQARRLGGKLRRGGHRAHLQPNGWASGVTGGVVIGSRSAVWAPTGPLAAVVVLDEHDESLQEERVPTWHARDVAIERARRAGAPCVLVSPAPSLAALAAADRVLTVDRSVERRGWAPLEIVDRRDDEPGRSGLFSARAADVLRSTATGVAVLNRKGRAQMLACGSCGELVKTEDGEFLMTEVDGALVSPRTGETRPLICAVCTGTSLKRIRLGVTRATEELSLLVGRPVSEVSADRQDQDKPGTDGGLVLGTEAALHAAASFDTVVFLDFDQELHAPRYRAAEQAMWLLVRAARLVGGRRPEARVLVQTRSPEHRTLQAALRADPSRMLELEEQLRQSMGFPPFGALAEISGAGAERYCADLAAALSTTAPSTTAPSTTAPSTTAPSNTAPSTTAPSTTAPATELESAAAVMGPRADGRYLVRAPDPQVLADLLQSVPRPKGRMRVAVDPPRI